MAVAMGAKKRRLTVLFTLRRPLGGSGYTKPCSGFQPSARFCSATVWAGVVASQRPIACPNRRKQPDVMRNTG